MRAAYFLTRPNLLISYHSIPIGSKSQSNYLLYMTQRPQFNPPPAKEDSMPLVTATVACIAVVYVSTVLAFIGLAEVAATAPSSRLRGGGYRPKYWMQAFPRRKLASESYLHEH